MTMNNTTFTTTTASAYDVYHVGDTFKNDNGESYIVLGISKERDKALLAKNLTENEAKLVDRPVLYIGAKGLHLTCWSNGHYFMTDFKAAVEWFETDDNIKKKEEKKILVKDILNLNKEEHVLHFVDVAEALNKFCSIDGYKWVPDAILEAEVLKFEISIEEMFPGDPEFQYPLIHFYISSKINPDISEYMGTMTVG